MPESQEPRSIAALRTLALAAVTSLALTACSDDENCHAGPCQPIYVNTEGVPPDLETSARLIEIAEAATDGWNGLRYRFALRRTFNAAGYIEVCPLCDRQDEYVRRALTFIEEDEGDGN